MTSIEFSERQNAVFDKLIQLGIIKPADINDPEIRNALNTAQEELIRKLYEAD